MIQNTPVLTDMEPHIPQDMDVQIIDIQIDNEKLRDFFTITQAYQTLYIPCVAYEPVHGQLRIFFMRKEYQVC